MVVLIFILLVLPLYCVALCAQRFIWFSKMVKIPFVPSLSKSQIGEEYILDLQKNSYHVC